MELKLIKLFFFLVFIFRMCGIQNLSDILLLKIFSYVETEDLVINGRNVCIRWRHIVDSHVFWKKIVYSPGNIQLETISKFLQNMPSLTRYHEFQEIPHDKGEAIIRLLATNCKQLRELILPNIVASPEALELLHKNVHGLEELAITISLQNQSVTQVIGRFHTLKQLSLTKNPNDLLSNPDVLSPIRFGCPNLRVLDFQGFDRGIAVDDLNLLIASKANALRTFLWAGAMHSSTLMTLGECRILSEINLNRFKVSDYNHQYTPIPLIESIVKIFYEMSEIEYLPAILANSYSQLRCLIIYYVTGNTTICLTVILSNCANLEKLHLSHFEVTSDVLCQISSKFLTNILISNFVGWSQSSIRHLAVTCSNLAKFRVCECDVSEEMFSEMLQFQNLEHLYFSQCDLSELDFVRIETCLPHLKELRLLECNIQPSQNNAVLALKSRRPNIKIYTHFI